MCLQMAKWCVWASKVMNMCKNYYTISMNVLLIKILNYFLLIYYFLIAYLSIINLKWFVWFHENHDNGSEESEQLQCTSNFKANENRIKKLNKWVTQKVKQV